MKKNSWGVKIKRTLTSLHPVTVNRQGQCVNCGACCKLPNVCPFLKYKTDGSSYCSIHSVRPMNCRKYPRTADEWLTEGTCGYNFDE